MFRFLLTILLLSLSISAAAATATMANDTLTLAEAVKIALVHNPSLREAEAKTQGALEDIKSTRADMLPKASSQYGYTRLEDEPFQKSGGVERVVGDNDVHHWDISLTQPLFTGFANQSRHQMAKISAEIEKLGQQQARIAVSQDLKIAWFEALLADRIGRVAEENIIALNAHKEQATGFFRQGLISRNDLLKAEVASANAIQEGARATAATEVARTRLANIIGIELETGRTLEDIATIGRGPGDLPALYEEARQNSPVLKSYRLGLDNLAESVILAKSTYYPSVALVGKYEQNGNDIGAATNDFSNEHNTSIAVTAKWDFFEWGKTGANVAKQKFARQAMVEKMQGVENQLMLEVRKAFLDLQVARGSIDTAQKALEQARENWRITNLQYSNQVATSTDVLDARTMLTQAETNYYRAVYGYGIALAQLERALGRG